MKKTFTINISGNIFHIEEDAYEKLQGYLQKLKNHFGSGIDGREIVADIESRISELFLEKSKGDNKVVVVEWVEEVISRMGTPEDFVNQESESDVVSAGPARGVKRLYRDYDNRVIAGVCSGLGAYFNIDPVVMRIIFVVLLLANGIGIIAYLVLWIAVPKAVTSSQRLEMRGHEVNISNIERSVREEGQEPKAESSLAENAAQPAVKAKPASDSCLINDLARGTIKVLAIVLGVFLILAGFFGLLGFISTLVIGQTFLSDWPLVWSPNFQVPDMLGHFVSRSGLAWGMVSIALLAGIPLLAMLFIGTKLVFRYRSNNTAIGTGMVAVWFLALLSLVVVSASEAGHYKVENSLSGSETLYPARDKTFHLRLASDNFGGYGEVEPDLGIDRFKMIRVDGKNILLGEPRLDIDKSDSPECLVVVKKWSRGKNTADVNDRIQKIIYRYQSTDTSLVLDPWFLLGDDQKWRDQQVEVTLKVPEGVSLYLDESLVRILDDANNLSGTWERDMTGKIWTMLPEGLALKDSLSRVVR